MHKIIYEFERNAAVRLLGAMASDNRLLILSLLLDHEISVRELAALAGLSQSALSQHLAKLRHLGLVTTRRDAQTIYYNCNSAVVKVMLLTLSDLFAQCEAEAPLADGELTTSA